MVKLFFTICSISFIQFCGIAQCTTELKWEFPYNGNISPFSIEVDKEDRPYLYIASNEDGLVILTVDGEFVTQIPVDNLMGQVKNLEQVGHLLFLAEGSHNQNSAPALQILDISDPTHPNILGSWTGETDNGRGSGIVKIVNDYAYLGAMSQGLIILNIADPTQIFEEGRIEFDINFPFNNPNTESFYNSRGFEVIDNLAYVCHDAGGLHIVDCSNPSLPVEIGMYANPVTYEPSNMPRAYNNIVIDDSIAFIAVDYCGIESLDISDPANIILLDHYNPRDCPTGLWWDAPIHTNELALNKNCKTLFATSGKSELIIMDVSDPSNIKACGTYGTVEDTTATWGLDMRRDSIFLTYITIPIYIPFIHPFDARWPGIKMVQWDDPCAEFTLFTNELADGKIKVIPNPSSGNFSIDFTGYEVQKISIINLNGQNIYSNSNIPLTNLNIQKEFAPGIYFLTIETLNKRMTKRIIIH